MENALIDVAGNTIEPGDTVVYPQMSGRSVQIVLGRLVSYNGKTAQIERLEGARWSASYGETRYRDKRTGKGIDPYAASLKHYKVKPRSYYKHPNTGEEISDEEHRKRYPMRWGYIADREFGKWRPVIERGEWHDYVEKYEATPRPVTIQNVSNIVKVFPVEVDE